MMITGIYKPSMILLSVLLAITGLLPGCIDIIEPDNLTETLDNVTTADNTTVYLPPLEYDYSASIAYNDTERNFIIHIGSSYTPGKSTPLVFVLHGGGSTAESMAAFTGFNAIADRENFIVVYPKGIENYWNDGREPKVYRTHVENTDDVGFISSLIDAISVDLNIDADRIFATGMSNGGMMSYRLACELSDRIAAIAAVASSMPSNMVDVCDPSRPVSVLIINGTDDPIVPWEGGPLALSEISLGNVISINDVAEFWKEKTGCLMRPEVTWLSERNLNDGTSVWMETYSGCADGTEVVLMGIDGGGHTWPGAYQYASEEIIGKTSLEFDASEIIWQFFEEHPMN
jgi:polyhydroxybutyrate depolymerase